MNSNGDDSINIKKERIIKYEKELDPRIEAIIINSKKNIISVKYITIDESMGFLRDIIFFEILYAY